jgi:hypothetical protein
MFTFCNIVLATDGRSQASQCETPARFARSFTTVQFICQVCQRTNWPPPPEKKSEAKPSGTVCRTPLGVDKVPQNPHRSDKIMSFF